MQLKKLFWITEILGTCNFFGNNFLGTFCLKDKIYAKIRIFYAYHGQFQKIHLSLSVFLIGVVFLKNRQITSMLIKQQSRSRSRIVF
jgi:hypothetical protein